jgi:hypothetical protein
MSCSITMLLFCIVVIPSVLIPSTTSPFHVVAAWVPQQQQMLSVHRHATCAHNSACYSKPTFARHQHLLSCKQSENESTSKSLDIGKSMRSIFTATSFLTVGWWLSSVAVPYLPQSYDSNTNFNPIVLNVANAKEMASGSGSRVNKDPESLLRYGLPIQNKEVRINCRFCIKIERFIDRIGADTTCCPLFFSNRFDLLTGRCENCKQR